MTRKAPPGAFQASSGSTTFWRLLDMAKGLDVGTMNIIAAERHGDKTTLTQQRNSFVEIEYSDVAEKMLARSDVLYIKKDNQVFIVGEDALNFANIFNTAT